MSTGFPILLCIVQVRTIGRLLYPLLAYSSCHYTVYNAWGQLATTSCQRLYCRSIFSGHTNNTCTMLSNCPRLQNHDQTTLIEKWKCPTGLKCPCHFMVKLPNSHPEGEIIQKYSRNANLLNVKMPNLCGPQMSCQTYSKHGRPQIPLLVSLNMIFGLDLHFHHSSCIWQITVLVSWANVEIRINKVNWKVSRNFRIPWSCNNHFHHKIIYIDMVSFRSVLHISRSNDIATTNHWLKLNERDTWNLGYLAPFIPFYLILCSNMLV